jgi:S-adenosylmethionine-diacylglycerol 3-amino-3-carboxypropyl transferase
MRELTVSTARRPLHSELGARTHYTGIRYAQCWEDADVLLAALDVQPGDTCLSIGSAGDNTLALLTKAPGRVVAVDLSTAQIACLELRVAAYRALRHDELLELMGSTPSIRRDELYRRCRGQLAPATRDFWDALPDAVAGGIGAAGKFERYLAVFRERILPLVHPRRVVERLLMGGDVEQRRAFYAREWDTWRWRALFRLFFSRFIMARSGRDAAFFKYARGGVAEHLLARTHYALTEVDPAQNPYVQWILTGRHTTALPYALRPEHFDSIRSRLDRLEWRCQSVEDYLSTADADTIDRFNLSDMFEYVSLQQYHRTLASVIRAGRPGARLAYWNMLVPRGRPAGMADRLASRSTLAERLHSEDKAFFYRRFVVEEVT